MCEPVCVVVGRVSELVRERGKEKEKGGGHTERAKEGGSFWEQFWTTAQTLQSFFCFSEETGLPFLLPNAPSYFFRGCIAMTLMDTLISSST